MGKSARSKMQANCPFCTQSIFRKDMDRHLRTEHGGKDVNRTICVWPDCGLQYEDKGLFEKHMYSHTDLRARHCPYFKEGPNGQRIACRFVLMNQSAAACHEKKSHTIDRLLPDGSLAPQVVEPYISVEPAVAGSSGSGHGTQGKETDPCPEISLDGLLQIEPEEDDSDFINPPLLKPPITSMKEPKVSSAKIANNDVGVVSTPTLVPPVSKRRGRRHVKNPKEDLAKNDSRKMTPGFLKKQISVSVPKI